MPVGNAALRSVASGARRTGVWPGFASAASEGTDSYESMMSLRQRGVSFALGPALA